LFKWKAKAPVDETTRLWVEHSMQRLSEMFGAERLQNATVALPTKEFFPDVWSDPEEGVELLLRRVCALMEVERERVDLETVYEEPDWGRELPQLSHKQSGAAGLYVPPQGEAKEVIVVALREGSQPPAIIATLAHELGHVLLLGDGRLARDDEQHELLTDLLTVFLGLGVFTANSAFQFAQFSGPARSGWSMRRQGYLPEAVWAYSLAYFAHLRGEKRPAWSKHLNDNIRAYFNQSCRFIEQTREKR